MDKIEQIINQYGIGKRFPPLEQPRQIKGFSLGWRVEMTGFREGYEVLEFINDGKQMWSYRQNEYRHWFSVLPEPTNTHRLDVIAKVANDKDQVVAKKKCQQCGTVRVLSKFKRFNRGYAKICNKCKG